jgi:hypothetical protein
MAHRKRSTSMRPGLAYGAGAILGIGAVAVLAIAMLTDSAELRAMAVAMVFAGLAATGAGMTAPRS